MPSKKKPENHSLTQSDVTLWKAVTDDVKRLPGRDYKKAAAEAVSCKKTLQQQTREAPLPAPKKEPRKASAPNGLDRRTDERLRKGQMKIDARLDLHGLNQGEARMALRAALSKAYERGKRCVLVITGKGRSSREEGGVLRKKLPGWLAEAPLKNIVLKTHPAKPRDGGEGAVYVLLRRQRDDRD